MDTDVHLVGIAMDVSEEGEAKSMPPVLWASSNEVTEVLKSGKWPGKTYAQQLLTLLR